MITDIETGGGVDEILSLFGANRYKIVSNSKQFEDYNCISSLKLDKITSKDDIKLLISIDNNYLADISPTGIVQEGGRAYAILFLNINGLTRTFVATTSMNISSNNAIISYEKTRNVFELDNYIDTYEVIYPNPMTSLVIYNVAETS